MAMTEDMEYPRLTPPGDRMPSGRSLFRRPDELTDEQVVELGQLDTSDHTTLQHWLVANVTELNVIIEDEVAILLGEIAENSQSI